MNSLAQSFVEGGPLMYPIALLACALPAAAVGLLVIALFSRKNRALPFGIALLVAALVPAALGVLAERFSMRRAEDAIAHADPADQATIRAAAMGEAMNTTAWGLGAALAPTFIGFALFGVGLSKLERFKV